MKVLSAYEIKGRGVVVCIDATHRIIKSGDILRAEIKSVETFRILPDEAAFDHNIGLLLGDCEIISKTEEWR